MDYKSMGQIYKGLSQAGAWGCFDEFNRIPIEVLSVCSTQWKCILDAKRARKARFIFEDEDILLEWKPPCNAFITMNPGYAGRTELPESLKVLFRPVAMIVPDMDMITEIMLMSEGFAEGRILARKFMILYRLCEALLSKQFHYDWKLRAVKTTLNVAGGMRRQSPDLSEDKVLLRALRDFNLGKLVPDDVDIFMGLLNDLFPKTLELVIRGQDFAFEKVVRDACRRDYLSVHALRLSVPVVYPSCDSQYLQCNQHPYCGHAHK
jgi:dynein heavy chain